MSIKYFKKSIDIIDKLLYSVRSLKNKVGAKMTRLIRVMKTNANVIIQALQSEGHQAEVVDKSLMPAPEVWCYRSYPGSNWHQEQQDLAEMVKGQVPLQISCSGKQANKVISKLKTSQVI